MAFELVVHTPDGDIVLGSYQTKTAAEKMAVLTVSAWEQWSIVEVDGEAHPADVLDLAAYRAKRKRRHNPH